MRLSLLALVWPALAAAQPFSLVDRAREAGLGHVSVDFDSWYATGAAFVDLDGDHWPDLYFCAGMGQHDVLCLNQRNGTFACNPMAQANATSSFAIAAGDVDGDGDLDLYVMRYSGNSLLENDGHANFRDVTDEKQAGGDPMRPTTTGTFLDYDGDGRLDLYLGHWFASGTWPAARDQLLRQQEDGTFVETTQAAHLDDKSYSSLALLAFDYDGDGKQDLYVTGDYSPAFLFHNQGDGTFVDATAQQPADFTAAVTEGMGIDIADWDGDGDFDLYVAASKRPGGPFGSAFYVNQGGGQFVSSAAKYGVLGDFGWGTGWVDLDLDGWPDIALAGDIADHHFLFHNLGGQSFEEQDLPGKQLGVQDCVTLAFADYDYDGRIDMLLVRHNGDAPELYRNETPPSGHWLEVRLEGAPPLRDPLGALVQVTAGGRMQPKQLLSQSSKGAQNDRRMHFGLGAAAASADVKVTWPGGAIDEVHGLPVDREVTIGQGVGFVDSAPAPYDPGCAIGRGRPSALVGLALLGMLWGMLVVARRRRRAP